MVWVSNGVDTIFGGSISEDNINESFNGESFAGPSSCNIYSNYGGDGIVSNKSENCMRGAGDGYGTKECNATAGNNGGECCGDCKLTLLHWESGARGGCTKQNLVIQMVVQLN